MSAVAKTSQTERFRAWLVERGPGGVHTFEMRRAFMGNPSQRRKDLEAQGVHLIVGPRERLHGDAVGVRIWLAEHAPAEYGGGQHPLTEVDDAGCVRLAV
jgi:hypothetical protein